MIGSGFASRFLPALTSLLLVASAARAERAAKYVFLMIGDGMAGPQRAAAEFFAHSQSVAQAAGEQKATVGITPLTMSTFPVQGLTSTYALNAIITDSAASGTAMACGQKTYSGVVAMAPDRKTPLPTLAEIARRHGRAVGIVSSVSIDHATPACFYAHAPSRGDYWGIAMQLAQSGFDYFGGGAAKGAKESKRRAPDGTVRQDPVQAARENGYAVVRTRKELQACNPGQKVWAYNLTVDEDCALYYAMDTSASHITLAEFTRKGIELLDNPNGFFMMVEGGKIDWACHANDAAAAIHDTLAFDEAVKEAYEFYRNHPEDTLIVVTGDHECGGMTIGFAGTKYESFPAKLAAQTGSYQIFDQRVAVLRENGATFGQVLTQVEECFGLSDLDAQEMGELAKAWQESMAGKELRARNDAAYLLYGYYEPLTVKCTHLLNRRAGIGWTSFSHTGVPVVTSAVGVGAERFGGYYDNTRIFHRISALMTGQEEVAER